MWLASPRSKWVDAELVDEEAALQRPLPVPSPAPEPRALMDRYIMLRPGAPIPTQADLPTCTEADFRISQETADLIDEAPPANTSCTDDSALGSSGSGVPSAAGC